MDKIIDLLTVLSQSLKENNNRSVSGDSFNIFNVLGIQSKEVILCRFIGEFLDPNGMHSCRCPGKLVRRVREPSEGFGFKHS